MDRVVAAAAARPADTQTGLRQTRNWALSAGALASPRTGEALRVACGFGADGLSEAAGVLTDGARDFPVVDGIPYLRLGAVDARLVRIRERAVEHLRAGQEAAALHLLLTDQDAFAPLPPPSPEAVERVVAQRDTISLREAMRLLSFGPVATYFAHRWSSPTYFSGLALLARVASPTCETVEVACGIGHFLRVLQGANFPAAGIDLVFAKLWLARHFLGVDAPLVCADVEQGPALRPSQARAVFCHDAFYFLRDKASALRHLRGLSSGGTLAVGHVHTARDAHEAGFAEGLDAYDQLRGPDATPLLDDGALARDYARGRLNGAPEPARADSGAVAWLEGPPHGRATAWPVRLDRLRVNPALTGEDAPGEGWWSEYRGDAGDFGSDALDAFAKTPLVRQVVARGNAGVPELDDGLARLLHRGRVLLDLPLRW